MSYAECCALHFVQIDMQQIMQQDYDRIDTSPIADRGRRGRAQSRSLSPKAPPTRAQPPSAPKIKIHLSQPVLSRACATSFSASEKPPPKYTSVKRKTSVEFTPPAKHSKPTTSPSLAQAPVDMSDTEDADPLPSIPSYDAMVQTSEAMIDDEEPDQPGAQQSDPTHKKFTDAQRAARIRTAGEQYNCEVLKCSRPEEHGVVCCRTDFVSTARDSSPYFIVFFFFFGGLLVCAIFFLVFFAYPSFLPYILLCVCSHYICLSTSCLIYQLVFCFLSLFLHSRWPSRSSRPFPRFEGESTWEYFRRCERLLDGRLPALIDALEDSKPTQRILQSLHGYARRVLKENGPQPN